MVKRGAVRQTKLLTGGGCKRSSSNLMHPLQPLYSADKNGKSATLRRGCLHVLRISLILAPG